MRSKVMGMHLQLRQYNDCCVIELTQRIHAKLRMPYVARKRSDGSEVWKAAGSIPGQGKRTRQKKIGSLAMQV